MRGGREIYPGGMIDQKEIARLSTILGIVMLAGWLIPFIGLPLGVTGLALGITGRSSSRKDLASAGIFLNSLGLGLTAANVIVTFYLLITGKLDQLFFYLQ